MQNKLQFKNKKHEDKYSKLDDTSENNKKQTNKQKNALNIQSLTLIRLLMGHISTSIFFLKVVKK